MRRIMRLVRGMAFLVTVLPGLAQVPTAEIPRRISSPISFYDDADITKPGTINMSQDIEYARTVGGKDFAFPSSYFSAGLNKRLEVSGGIGYVRSQFEELRVNGLADTYIGGKVLLFAEGKRRPALAVKPTLEVLGAPSIANNLLAPGRVNFLLPFMVEKSFEQFRVYYTVGYLTRGLFFQSLAYELNHWSRVTPTVILLHSRLTHELRLVSDLGLNRSRSDVLGSVAVTLSPHWSVYGSAGRSFGRTDVNSARYQLSGGFSVNFRVW